MKNAAINFITLFLGFISLVFLTVFGLAFTALLLAFTLISKPFIVKILKRKLAQVQVQRTANIPTGDVFEGKCERVYK